MPEKPTSEKKQPANTIRGSAGRGLKLTLWENHGDEGRVWYNGTLSRSYKDQGGQWHETNSYDQRDFLEIGEMFREAHAWVKEQTRAKAAQQGQEAEQAGHAERETERKRAGGRNR